MSDPLHQRARLLRAAVGFAVVARERLPSVACGDAHLPEHVLTWKTLLPCGQTEGAVVAYLRSASPAHLTRVDAPVEAAAHAA